MRTSAGFCYQVAIISPQAELHGTQIKPPSVCKPYQITAIALQSAANTGSPPIFAEALVLKSSRCSIIMAVEVNNADPRSSEVVQRDQAFDGIDWSAAAPGWVSMLTGIFLPLLALALLVVSIDLGLGWLFARWAGPSSSMSPLLLAAIMFPPALIGAFGCCKLFLSLKDAMRTAARSGKRENVV
jgi:hypothetical protein